MASGKHEELTELIKERHPSASQGDLYGVLGVETSASGDAIKRAYIEIAKRLHPDRIGSQFDDELKQMAAKIFNVATNAHDTLTNNRKRREYLDAVQEQSTSAKHSPGAGSETELSKIAFHKGSVMLTKRSYAEAESYLQEAVRVSPNVARFWQSLGWAIYQNVEARTDADRLEEARDCWEEALELNESDYTSLYYLALYWKAKDDSERCREALVAALRYKPNFIDAKRELRLMRMRRKNKRGNGGFLGKLFGGRK